MKAIYDRVAARSSKLITRTYSTSFSAGIRLLSPAFQEAIYGIYGFVRLADEIVDSFHGYDQRALIARFRADTDEAISQGISMNPVLHSFQHTVYRFDIPLDLIDTFLNSMEMDLDQNRYTDEEYRQYIVGSAESVGLMCLRVFTFQQPQLYESLKPYAMTLGSAFQKVNFLRDARHDFETLGRIYFPGVNLTRFSPEEKQQIENDIAEEFRFALEGIRKLPAGSRRGVYLAYIYYYNLFRKIRKLQPHHVLKKRIRISNGKKLSLLFHSVVKHQFDLI